MAIRHGALLLELLKWEVLGQFPLRRRVRGGFEPPSLEVVQAHSDTEQAFDTLAAGEYITPQRAGYRQNSGVLSPSGGLLSRGGMC